MNDASVSRQMADPAVSVGEAPPSKVRNRILWTLQIIAALFFLAAAASKFAGAEYNIVVFEKVGLGQWFRYFAGAMEAIGAILIVTPRYSALGGIVLAVVMVGAFIADISRIGGNGIPALIALAVVASVAWCRRSTLLTLVGGRK